MNLGQNNVLNTYSFESIDRAGSERTCLYAYVGYASALGSSRAWPVRYTANHRLAFRPTIGHNKQAVSLAIYRLISDLMNTMTIFSPSFEY